MQRDQEFNSYYQSKGWTVLRFWNFEVKDELGACLKTTLNQLQ
jgi:DNA mismatch endonuclease, patch repair protein